MSFDDYVPHFQSWNIVTYHHSQPLCMAGVQTQILTPTPLPPPTPAPSKCSEFDREHREQKENMQNRQKKFTRDPPTHPPPQIWLLGLDPSWYWYWTPIFFSKPLHMCVQNDRRDEGIILRYGCWGTHDPHH